MTSFSMQWLGLALDGSVKSLLLAMTAAVLLRILQVRNSNIRHRVWIGALVGMLTLPALSQIMPGLQLPFISRPQWMMRPSVDAPTGLPFAQSAADAIAPPPLANAEVQSPAVLRTAGDEFSSSPRFNGSRQEIDDRGAVSDSSDRSAMPQDDPRVAATFDTAAVAALRSKQAIIESELIVSPPTWRTLALACWPQWLMALWLTGAGFIFLRLGLGVLMAWRLKRSSTEITVDDLREFGVTWMPASSRRAVPVYECPLIRVPLTVGFFRPAILLPEEWLEWTVEKLEAVLSHERTHVERGDCAVTFLAEFNLGFNWFHPLSWFLRRTLSILAEEACDDAAIGSIGDRATYARHLLEVAAAVSPRQGRLIQPGVAMARRSNVETRIDAILDLTRPLSERPTWATTLVILLLTLPVIGLAAALRPAGPNPIEDVVQEEAADVKTRVDEIDSRPVAAEETAANEPGAAEKNGRQAKPIEKMQKLTNAATAARGAVSPVDPENLKNTAEGPMRIFGSVVDPEGKIVAGAQVTIHRTKYPKLYAQSFPTKILATLTTDSEGRFEQLIEREKPSDQSFQYGGQRSSGWINVTAVKSGFGMAVAGHLNHDEPKPIELKLTVDEPVRGRVIDTEGRPIPDVAIQVVSLESAEATAVDQWLTEVRKSKDRVARSFTEERLPDTPRFPTQSIPQRSPQELPKTMTDARGQFEIAGMGRDRLLVLQMTGPGIALANVHIVTRPIESLRAQTRYRTMHRHVYYGSKFDYVADPGAPVEGIVKDRESGEPIAGAIVATDVIAGSRMSCDGLLMTTTDAQGHYRIEGLPIRSGSQLNVFPQGVPYLDATYVPVPASINMQPMTLDIPLQKSVWATGRVTNSKTGTPVKGCVFYTPFKSNPNTPKYPHLVDGIGRMLVNDVGHVTDDDGRFRLVVIPGRGVLGFKAAENEYCSGFGAADIPEFADGKERADITCDHLPVKFVDAVREVAPQEGEEEIVADLQVDPGQQATLRFVDESRQPLEAVKVLGTKPVRHTWETTKGSTATIFSLSLNETRLMQFKHEPSGLVGLIRYRLEPDHAEQEVVMRTPAIITGRLRSPDDEPLSQKQVTAEIAGSGLARLGQTNTGADGAFELLVPTGEPISIVMRGHHFHPIRSNLEALAGERIDLGDLEIDLDKPTSNATPKETEKRTPPKARAAQPKSDEARQSVDGKASARALAQTTPAADGKAENDSKREPQSASDDPLFRYAGSVVDDAGKPISDATISLNYSRPRVAEIPSPVARTNPDGKFEITRRKSEFADGWDSNAWEYATLVASKPGFGLASGRAINFETSGAAKAGLSEELRPAPTSLVNPETNVLKLPVDLPIKCRIITPDGQPVAGATLSVINAFEGASGSLEDWEKSAQEKGANYYTVQQKLQRLFGGDFVNGPIDHTISPATTDADGRITLTGLGRERLAKVFVTGPGIEASEFYVRARTGATIKLSDNDHGEDKWYKNYYPSEFTHVAGPSQPVSGVVKDLKTGQPLAGFFVRAERTTASPIGGHSGFIRATTDEQGRFTLNGFPLGDGNQFVVLPPKGSKYLPAGASIKTSLSSEPLVKDVTLTEGIVVRGKVTDAKTGKPVAGYAEYFVFTDNPALEQTKNFRIVDQRHMYNTDSQGEFEIPVLPGAGIVTFWANNFQAYPRGAGRESIQGKNSGIGGEMYAFSTWPHHVIADNCSHLTQIEPALDAKNVDIAMLLTPTQTFSVRVVAADGQPPKEYFLYGERSPASWYQGQRGSFTVRSYLADYGRRLMAFEPSTDLIGRLDVTGEPPADAVITLEPATRFIGRLVDENGAPLPETQIQNAWNRGDASDMAMMNYRRWQGGFDPERADFVPQKQQWVLTDENGRFELRGIMPGLKYSAQAMGLKKFGNESYQTTLGSVLEDVVAKPGPVNDLGDIVLKPKKPDAK